MIRLLCVLGHGHELLPHFIEHYTKYVDELQFVIYESKASPRILSRAKPIIEKYDNCKIVKVVREREFDWEKVTILYNMFKSKKKNDWWVIADIDETKGKPVEDIIRETGSYITDFYGKVQVDNLTQWLKDKFGI